MRAPGHTVVSGRCQRANNYMFVRGDRAWEARNQVQIIHITCAHAYMHRRRCVRSRGRSVMSQKTQRRWSGELYCKPFFVRQLSDFCQLGKQFHQLSDFCQELHEVHAVVKDAKDPQALNAAESARKRCRCNLMTQLVIDEAGVEIAVI